MFWNIFWLTVNAGLGGFLAFSCYKVGEGCGELTEANGVWEKNNIKGKIVSWLVFGCMAIILNMAIIFGGTTFKITEEMEKINTRITAIETQMNSSQVDTLFLKDI